MNGLDDSLRLRSSGAARKSYGGSDLVNEGTRFARTLPPRRKTPIRALVFGYLGMIGAWLMLPNSAYSSASPSSPSTSEVFTLRPPVPGFEPTIYGAVSARKDRSLYSHDSYLTRLGSDWLLAWNGNMVISGEDYPDQLNFIKRAPSWDAFDRAVPVAEFVDASWSTNPVDPTARQWHPTFIKIGNREECWWWTTGITGTPLDRSLGFRSVWDASTRKWTNWKIQLAAGGVVNFSSDVNTFELADRYTLPRSRQSVIANPLCEPIKTGSRWWWPMIVTNHASGGGHGTFVECTLLWSDDEGATWKWLGDVIPKEAGPRRNALWEPFPSYDAVTGKFYIHIRNFNGGQLLPGRGYSFSTSTDLTTLASWSTFTDSPIKVMPMRGISLFDGECYYVALAERDQVGTTFNSGERRPSALYRSRDGFNWVPIAPLALSHQNSYYCALYDAGDGWLYFSFTGNAGISVGRIPAPRTDEYHIHANRDFENDNSLLPDSNGRFINFCGNKCSRHSLDFVRSGAGFSSSGWSFAMVADVGGDNAGLLFDHQRDANQTLAYGTGFQFFFDGAMLPQLAGLADGFRSGWDLPNGYQRLFMALSCDETDGKLRVLRKPARGNAQIREWWVKRITAVNAPANLDTVKVNGRTYTFKDDVAGSGTFTGAAAGDLITQTSHGYVEGLPILVTSLSAASGLSADVQRYYVRNPTADSYQLSTSPTGAIIDITTNVTGKACPIGMDVLRTSDSGACLSRLRICMAYMDSTMLVSNKSNYWSTSAGAMRNHNLLLFFEQASDPGLVVDGVRLRSDGNKFDRPQNITFNASNITLPLTPRATPAGLRLWDFAAWNSRLTSDEMFSLLAQRQSLGLGTVPAAVVQKEWGSAEVRIDPANVDTAHYSNRPHLADITSAGIQLPGDASASVELPAHRDCRIAFDFRFDALPGDADFELLSIGNQDGPFSLTISRLNGVYTLKHGTTAIAVVTPGEWFPLRLTLTTVPTSTKATLVVEGVATYAPSGRYEPTLILGRFVRGLSAPITVANREPQYVTSIRALALTEPPPPVDPSLPWADDEEAAAPRLILNRATATATLTSSRTVVGHLYQLQTTTDLVTGPWVDIGEPIQGTAGPIEFSVSYDVAEPRRFYRVLISRSSVTD